MTSKKADSANTLTKREYAAIHLRVPDSGTDWIDDLIRRSTNCGDVTAPAEKGDSDGGTAAGPKTTAPKAKPQGPKDPTKSSGIKVG